MIKKIFILLAFITSISVFSAVNNDKGYYLGIGFGGISGQVGGLNIKQILSPIGVFGVNIVDDHLDFEIRANIDRSTKNSYTLKKSYGAYLVLSQPMSEILSLNFRTGYSYVNISNDIGSLNANESISHGVGFSYALGADNRLAVDYIRLIDKEIGGYSTKIDQFSLTINQYF